MYTYTCSSVTWFRTNISVFSPTVNSPFSVSPSKSYSTVAYKINNYNQKFNSNTSTCICTCPHMYVRAYMYMYVSSGAHENKHKSALVIFSLAPGFIKQ